MKDKKKAILAAALFALMGILIFLRIHSDSSSKTAVSAAHVDKRAARVAIPKTAINVNLSLLNRPKADFTASRNIFAPVYVKPSLPKLIGKGMLGASGKGNITVTPLKPLPPPPPPKSPAEIAEDNAREEINKIKVLGFLKRKLKTNVFLSLGQESYVVAKGGKITKDYYLTDVTTNSVTISDKKTGVSVKINTDFSKNASAKVYPSPGYGGGGGPAMGGMGYNPYAGRMPSPGMGYPGPAGRRLPGPMGGSGYIQPGIALPGAPAVQGTAAQRPSTNPLNNFSLR